MDEDHPDPDRDLFTAALLPPITAVAFLVALSSSRDGLLLHLRQLFPFWSISHAALGWLLLVIGCSIWFSNMPCLGRDELSGPGKEKYGFVAGCLFFLGQLLFGCVILFGAFFYL